ncbi:MAG: hypothetical protein BWY54_00186 [Candidatus Dependentiae bacterium ADurb.Bin331]|nr:MAG: hypothetical protein BWY54_00186 [Candidatus Dependentiae bacterium ADurb.Bin331]
MKTLVTNNAEEICFPNIGKVYQHYKGNKYKIVMIVFNSETDQLEPWVVYQGLYTDPKLGDQPLFTRSVAAFMETIAMNGKTIKRFTLLSE